ncbi:site-specific DNA-methyltransferase [Phascolarctobacterium succinatutens]|uniref:site-specific DNA-methyltransferase n=1 Tax=Phascolarctobacterium succinatutens TaxID=626940 RepID=UPI0023F67603|nr:site-specific DNA-methyltransferase [Phascolarctobacterium succinatutens]
MDKLKMHTPNRADDNFKKLAALFPNAVTETIDENGVVVRAIDKDVLMQEISCTVVDGNEERYQFTWPDKKKSVLLANAPINKTLRPCREESVDFDTTENLYIEGDNLEVLKLLQETYLGKIKVIFIDPPYNTGGDFLYDDNFAQSAEEYISISGQYDNDGNRLVKNFDSNGRFHTDWLNMMYPRLRLAKDILSDDGVIFISIDDNEVENLKKICCEVFGQSNFIANIVWQHSIQPKGYLGTFSVHHNHILCFSKSNNFELGSFERTAEDNKAYSNPDNDPKGPWRSGDVRNALYRPNLIYDIISPSGKVIKPCENGWRWSKETVQEKLRTGEIIFSKDETRIIRKIYLSTLEGRAPETIWFGKDVGTTREAMTELKKLFNKPPFDTPKPTGLIKKLLRLVQDNEYIVLDFFSGSATTAHAVMQLNAEDGGKRKFIMVQLPEETDEKSEAYKAGYKNICEIGKERIRRAGAKIKEEAGLTVQGLDIGFRVLKCDTSNMKDVYYSPTDFDMNLLDMMADNIKEDRNPEDLLFQVMLDLGVELASKIEETTIAGKKVFDVADGFLIACFDKDVNGEIIKAIAQKQPYYFVMRDSSLANDSVATNFEQIFATYSPDTVRKVL